MYKKARAKEDRLIQTDIRKKKAFYSDSQITADFLCKDCEHRFNIQGENLISKECIVGNKFILLDKVKSSKELTIVEGERWINPYANPDILEPDIYLYFAASVFWRSSAWTKFDSPNKGGLGQKYQEQFRKYLMYESAFPENAFLTVYVDNDKDPMPLILFPKSTNGSGFHQHMFFIPGIQFRLVVGKIGDEWKRIYETTKSKILFVEYSFEGSDTFNDIAKSFNNDFTPTKRLLDDSKDIK